MYDSYNVSEFLKKVNEAHLSMEEFASRMDMLSPESNKILCARWGLKKDDCSMGPVTLGAVLKVENAKVIIRASMAEFTYMKYVSYIKDRDYLGPTISHNLGYLLERANKYNPELFPNLGPDTVCGVKLLEQIDCFWEKQKHILQATFGLEDGSPEIYTQERVGEMFGLSGSRIGYYNQKSYRMLGNPKRRDQFFESGSEMKEKEQFVRVPINLSFMVNNDFCVRQLEIIKEKAAIDNILQLKEMLPDDLAELTGLAKEICAYWIYMANALESKHIFTRLEDSIDEIYLLKRRTKQALKRAGVETIQDFIEITLFKVRNIPNIGEKATQQIIRARKYIGFPIK